MKIATKTGDMGETSLFGGRRVRKSSGFIELVGELDELQAVVGWCRVEAGYEASILDRVVNDLYRIMSIVGFGMKCPKNIQPISEEDVEFLESEMKKYEVAARMAGGLNKFVRPGGSEISARLHIARTVCRRVERRMVRRVVAIIADMKEKMESDNGIVKILKYLNRLSDLLFVLASCPANTERAHKRAP